MDIMQRFPDENSAVKWFESMFWPDGCKCPHCESTDTYEVRNASGMPYRCRDCKRGFGVRTKTFLQSLRLLLFKWVWAIYLTLTALKDVSNMKRHHGLGVTRHTTWFMLQRIHETFEPIFGADFEGTIGSHKTYLGGLEKNKHANKKLSAGRGTIGNVPVAELKDCKKTGEIRTKVIESTEGATLKGFVYSNKPGSMVNTDESTSYQNLLDLNLETGTHSVGEWVNGMAYTNGLGGYWSHFRHAFHGTCHQLSKKAPEPLLYARVCGEAQYPRIEYHVAATTCGRLHGGETTQLSTTT